MASRHGAAASAGEVDQALHFEMGGPAWRLMQRLGIIQGSGPSVLRRSAWFILIAWVPLLLLAAVEGHALGPTPRTSLLLDFATYARLFIAVPLIFAAEALVGARLRAAGLRLAAGELVRPESRDGLAAAVARVRRRRESALPEIGLAIFALGAAWFITLEQITGIGAREAGWGHDGTHLLLAGIWYRAVAVPLIQFFALRWTWRWIIWALFLRDVAKLRLDLRPTHADMAAGLGFLGVAHLSMAIFPFAMSCIIAAELAFRIQFEGLTLGGLQALLPLAIAYLLFAELLCFGPLLVLTPALAEARRIALRDYGMLVQHHNQLFHAKWVEGPPEESPLGNPDMSSLIDLGSSYTVIRDMNLAPVSRRQLLQVAALAAVPALPLLFLTLPVSEVARLLLGVVG
jgi:hypothetical protein